MQNENLYPKTSPYNATTIIDNKYLGIMKSRSFFKDPNDVYMIISAVYEYRPDLLAHDLYNDSRLWWVFAERNPNRLSKDPYFDFKAGLGIYIPKIENLRQSLGL